MKKELYFALKKTTYAKDPHVPLHSICSVFGASDEPLKSVVIPLKGAATIVTALDVTARIAPLYPDYAITNLGPTECRVFMQHPPGSPLLKALKVLLLCLVMFFGGAVAIMTFHEDVGMGQVHSDIYAFFTGAEQENVPVVSVPYSIGVAVGFVMLFGLYRRRKSRPTVLDIDIHNYENELREYLSAQGNRPDG